MPVPGPTMMTGFVGSAGSRKADGRTCTRRNEGGRLAVGATVRRKRSYQVGAATRDHFTRYGGRRKRCGAAKICLFIERSSHLKTSRQQRAISQPRA
eukprot:5436901-Pleurochrysis_carterae.AAC.1